MTGSTETVDASILERVQRLLEGLKKTADGDILYGLIERALRKFTGKSGKVSIAFIVFLHKLLESYTSNSTSDPATRMKARLLQQRLVVFLPPPEIRPAQQPPATPATSTRASTAREGGARAMRDTSARDKQVLPEATQPVHADTGADHDEVDAMQLRLAHNVAEALARNRTFDTLLRNSLDALQKAGGGEIDELRDELSRGLEDLLKEQHNLGRNLSTTTTYLNAIHSDRRKLRDALNSARKHSLSDELTGLPNRTAFMRQLEGEIGRAKRYGFSLAVAIIDVDGLGSVNAAHGRPVGDAVLQCYTREVMSLFRGYDLVARYGEDEFAVLFPNTQKDGAAHAIEKAQRRAAETYISYNNRNIPLPSFSSVLTLYIHGEKPSAMIQRASEALDHAKQRGHGQVVVALPGN